MPIELYETLYMLDSNKMATAADAETIRTQLQASLEKYEAQILVTRSWDENRKLAYSIRRNNITHKKAHYHIIYYRMESTKQGSLDADMRLGMTDFLLRYMTSHIDAKLADAILDVAHKDNQPGFALRGMQEETSPTDINPASLGLLPGEFPPADLNGMGNGDGRESRGERGGGGGRRRRSEEKPD
jgi:ribosomal protein S6